MTKITTIAHIAIYLFSSEAIIAFSRHVLLAEYGAISPETWRKRESATRFKQVARAILYPLTSVPNTG
jgi:hypothetical protein